MQKKIETAQPLLDKLGKLTDTGYATELILDYKREDIKASRLLIKEWDYYYIGNSNFGVALTIADNSYMGLISASLVNFKTGFQHTKSKMIPFTNGKLKLPESSVIGNVEYVSKDIVMRFNNNGEKRELYCTIKNFLENKDLIVNLTLTDVPEDSMVIVTPFDNAPKSFYYNQKINCLTAEGFAKLDTEIFPFIKEDSLATLDWGRGVWTYKNTWYWSSLSAYVEGKKFGFNLGYGFGNCNAASENMLFWDGKAHKLTDISFNIPTKDGKEVFLEPWTITSSDKRLELKFLPILNRYSNTNVGVLCSTQNQVFGEFSGSAVLDDGRVIVLDRLVGFAEKVFNKW